MPRWPRAEPLLLESNAIAKLFEDTLETADRERLKKRWFATREGLIYFAWEAVRTKDEHDGRLKPMPRELYLEDHLRNLLREPTYFVLKSRQILITWCTFVYIAWLILRNRFCRVALVPKKDEDGEAHIEDRLKNTLWWSLPKWLQDEYDVAPNKGLFQLTEKRGVGNWASFVSSVARGEDQLRQYTNFFIYWDEMGYQPLARKTWRAAVPTAGSRDGNQGRICCTSTLSPGSYHDELMDPALVDLAIAVANGEAVADGRHIKSPGTGIAHYRNPKRGAFCAVYSFLADTAKRDPIWERREAVRFGGVESPDWQLDYRMRRDAMRGTKVYPNFDASWSIVPERPVNKDCEIFLSFDFGHTAPTAILFWEWNERERQLTCFEEIYFSNTPVGVFKAMIAARLGDRLGIPQEEVVFADLLGHNVGDPESPGMMQEFGQEPNPITITGNPPREDGTFWRVNDRKVGEWRLNTALQPGFICCGMRQHPDAGAPRGSCRAIVGVAEGKGSICGKQYPAKPMVVFMRGRAPNATAEIPRQARIDPANAELQVPERSKKFPDHASDSARYAVMRYPNFLAVEAEVEPIPEILRLPKAKMTAQQLFWREMAELKQKAIADQQEEDATGEIVYPEDEEEEGDIVPVGGADIW